MKQSKKDKKEQRARFMMSPYNLKEAKRVKEFRNAVIANGLMIVFIIIFVVVLFRRCAR